jgi:hypothetical protein
LSVLDPKSQALVDRLQAQLSNPDWLVLIWLYRSFPSVLNAIAVVAYGVFGKDSQGIGQ